MRGTFVNIVAIIAGTAVGLLFGRVIPTRVRETVMRAIGLATFALGLQMALKTTQPLIMVGAMVLGAITGELLSLEDRLEGFGRRLQKLVRRAPVLEPADGVAEPGGKGHLLVDGFVTASLLYCVGAMAVIGSMKDGLGDPSVLYVKSTLDGVASVALASTLGIGVGLSIVPVAIYQGSIALAAGWVQPFLTAAVVTELSATGGLLIAAIGLDLMSIKRLPVGNMLPAVFYAAALAYFFA